MAARPAWLIDAESLTRESEAKHHDGANQHLQDISLVTGFTAVYRIRLNSSSAGHSDDLVNV